MTQFEPGKGDMVFRLVVSVVALSMLVVAIALRGFPREAFLGEMTVLALGFLALSLFGSLRGMRGPRD